MKGEKRCYFAFCYRFNASLGREMDGWKVNRFGHDENLPFVCNLLIHFGECETAENNTKSYEGQM